MLHLLIQAPVDKSYHLFICMKATSHIDRFLLYNTGMEIGMLVNTSEIKSMVSGSITLPTAIFMKDHGMKVGSKAMECILSEVVRQGVENGMMAISRFPSPLSQMQFFKQFR